MKCVHTILVLCFVFLTALTGCDKQSCLSPAHIRITAYPSTASAVTERMQWTDVPLSSSECRPNLYPDRIVWNEHCIIIDGHNIKPNTTWFLAWDASMVDGTLVCAIVESMVPRFILQRGEDAKLHVIKSNDHSFSHECFSVKGFSGSGFDQDTPTFIRVDGNEVFHGGNETFAFVLIPKYNEYICTTVPQNGINRLSVSATDDEVVVFLDASKYLRERTRWTAVWKRHCSRLDEQ